ncbi:putative ATP-dependent endonuclease of OLD family [Streptomyces sp. SAI-117]|uniref:ATP-dependent nuclease n=1 Tax=Streptomyces sp. SAI-117 TaxID=2940546 RepID=UPI002476A55A|nr:TOPRIM nucleotidyl transferase/hydrolase domain-containing protein [Streptomyces sp. SAI-117]MDH6573209.1 putative ATP-dependent endonuclease of OLD family [Streptomyces sp. SAI-117]
MRVEDFHVPADETVAPAARSLTIEAVLAFPELDAESDSSVGPHGGVPSGPVEPQRAVPEFFRRMAAAEDGDLKVRIVLRADWVDDGTVDGVITEARMAVNTLAEDYSEDNQAPLTPAERSRIQMIYIPASRDGVRQVTSFLRSRLWRAAQWSTGLRDLASRNAAAVAEKFTDEPVVRAVESALGGRWQELHGAGVHADPKLRLLDGDFDQLVRDSELVFEPDHHSRARPARMLSDGQRSLLHLALVSAALDVETAVCAGQHSDDFALDAAHLPHLTLIAVEEPENNLSPFFLSRIVTQLNDLSSGPSTQTILSSHSASVMTRVRPEDVRYFRTDPETATASVRELTLPAHDTDGGKYLREAVYAHPELYFAKFVVLGEGDTEQLVIPRIAHAHGIQLDTSFVAMVPLEGRHTNHMWQLLNDLDIPHATLLDFDYGKDGAGPGRLRDACTRLIASGLDPLEGLDGYDTVASIHDDLDIAALRSIMRHLQKFAVFYATPLDLDYAMLRAFEDAYKHLEQGELGPRPTDPTTTVFGENGTQSAFWSSTERLELLRWYRYLFLNRSKPSTHLKALSRLSDIELKTAAPPILTALVQHIQERIFV